MSHIYQRSNIRDTWRYFDCYGLIKKKKLIREYDKDKVECKTNKFYLRRKKL
jgi:hypothetical protein